MEQFLGIHIMASIVKMPSYRMHWADTTRFVRIAHVMPRNRSDKVRKFFHINESNMEAPGDLDSNKLFKVRPLWTASKPVS
jgi:hypothetical protein